MGKLQALCFCVSMFKKGIWLTSYIFTYGPVDVKFTYSFSLLNLDWREKIAALTHQEGIFSEVDECRRKKGEGKMIV